MTIKFQNYAKKIGQRGDYNWYRWKVFVDEDEDKLDEIKEVEYLLHQTFPNPLRIARESKSAFSIESAGWGSFPIFITIRFKDGHEENTNYLLDLNKPWPSP